MWNSRPVRILWHSFNWLTRVAIICAATMGVMLAIGIIALRYWLLPDIEQYHEKITASLTRAIGRPVTIEKISADWQGLNPRLSLVNLKMLDAQKNPALVLPSVRVSASWWSLLSAQLRFSNLEIDRPELLIRRDAQGNMFIGGVPISKQGGGDSDLADWVLHQSRMVARNALIVWYDEQRAAPPLIMENVDVRIENLFRHHQFALRAVVPSELASPLDVRGDFYGSSFSETENWRGQVFTQLQYADITAWRPWLDLPHEFSRGRGALRGWLDVVDGKIARLQVDLAVRDVSTKLADDVPEMTLRTLQGRAIWHTLDTGFELETKRLTMQLENGVSLPTTDFYLRVLNAQDQQPASGEIRANLLQLETLVSIANFVPIPADLRSELDAFAPRGKVQSLQAKWRGSPQHLDGFLLKGKFDNIALRQVGKVPGFVGLSAEIDGDQNSGKVRVKSQHLQVDAPDILRETLAFDMLTGTASWRHQDKELVVDVDSLAVSNADAEGKAHGSYRTVQGTPGILDLSVNLARADARQVARYTPLIAVNRKVNDWLHDALLAGISHDFHLRILGNLKDFPFDQATQGEFELGAYIQGGAVQFGKDWPVIEKASATLLMRGKKLELLATSANTVGVALHDLSLTLPDITAPVPSLEIKTQADDATHDFLQYVQHSPVRGYTQGFTDSISAQGSGHLDLAIHIPHLGENLADVQGVYRINNNQIDLGGQVPIARKVNGELRFTQSDFQTRQLTAEMLGGPAQIDVKVSAASGVLATLDGMSNMDMLRVTNPHPLLNYVHGGAAWSARVTAANKALHVQINSSLQGVSTTFPSPFTKAKNDALALSVELNSGASNGARTTEGLSTVAIELDKLLSAKILLQNQSGTSSIKRAAINFGGQGRWPEQDGIWLLGSLPVLSVQGWDGLLETAASASAVAVTIPIDGADLRIAKLMGYGHSITDLHVTASKRGDGLAAQLNSQVLNGELIWQPHGFQNSGKLIAHLHNLSWATDEDVAASKPVMESPVSSVPSVLQPGKLPTLEVTVDQLTVDKKQLGKLEVIGHPDGDSWRLRRLILTNPDGSLSGDGLWLGGAGKPQTKLNLLMEISNAGKILDRSGYPDTFKDGSGKLQVNATWTGAPEEFNVQTLAGTLKLDTGKGQFVKLDPSVSKLAGVLSVLSLQALPKHIALDFTDVFSAGFQFDNINGNANIHDGKITTQDFHIDGSAAKVLMQGNVDLTRETQDLHVEVLPSIGSGISLIGAFVISPVVGISAFVVDKILGNPLDKLVSFEYNVSGTWVDPTVTKMGEKPVPIRTKSDIATDVLKPDTLLSPDKTNQPIPP